MIHSVKLILLFGVLYVALFLIIEVLQRKIFTKFIWARRATHIGAGILAYSMPDYLNRNEIILLAIFFSIILGLSKWKKILSLHNVDRKTLGEIFYPLGILILSYICLPQFIISYKLGILILAFSDSIAGIVGDIWKFKCVRVFNNCKSLGGAIAFFIVTVVILLICIGVSSQTLLIIIGFAFLLTVIEFISIFGTDNIILPVLTALAHIYLVTNDLL